MNIENLKANIDKEKKIISELNLIIQEHEKAISVEEKTFFKNAAFSLLEQVEILNDSILPIISALAPAAPAEQKKLPVQQPIKQMIPVKEIRPGARISTQTGILTITKEDRERFIESLKIEEETLVLLRKKLAKRKEIVPEETVFRKPSAYVATSNKFFGNLSSKLAKADFFKSLNHNLKKANMPYLLSSFISLMLFTSMLVLFLAIIAAVVITLLFFKTHIAISLIQNILISLAAPIITFFVMFIYPSSEASSIQRNIDNELPFAVMHMAAVAGSGIEPTQIFKIIALSKEYKYFGKEIRKIINQINLYGYDLTTSLQSVAKITSSKKLSELLNGMATTIATGGDLRSYLDKRASDAMVDYKLARRKYVALAGTYADIYAGLLIAAPLIFMLMLVVINTIGGTIAGLSTSSIATLGIVGLIIVNILFIVFLQLSSRREA